MKISFTNGDEYEGDMLIGYYHGQGKLTYADGKGYYKGTWARDQMHGNGERLYANGNFFQGTFYEGMIHGEGRMKFSNGDQFVGMLTRNNINMKYYYICCISLVWIFFIICFLLLVFYV